MERALINSLRSFPLKFYGTRASRIFRWSSFPRYRRACAGPRSCSTCLVSDHLYVFIFFFYFCRDYYVVLCIRSTDLILYYCYKVILSFIYYCYFKFFSLVLLLQEVFSFITEFEDPSKPLLWWVWGSENLLRLSLSISRNLNLYRV